MSTQATWNLPAGRLPEPERVPQGFLFTDRNDKFSSGKFIFGCLWLSIWCGISFPMFAIALITFVANPVSFSIVPLLFIGVFAIIGVVGLFWGLRWLRVVVRLKPGQVVLPSYPLRLGESSTIVYQRRLRRGYTPRPGMITATWICYEWVQYRRGTDTETRTHTLWEKELPDASVESGTQVVEYETQVMVSPQYPPSLDARHNQVRWELRVKVELPGVATDTSYFQFRVMPEVIA